MQKEKVLVSALFIPAVAFLALLSILGLIFLYLLGMELVGAYGYCIKTGTMMTEHEKLNRAIVVINRRSDVTITRHHIVRGIEKNYDSRPRVSYASVDEFLSKNKDCCTIEPAGNLQALFNKLGGQASSEARINYTAYFTDEDGQVRSEEKRASVAVDECGKIVGSYED